MNVETSAVKKVIISDVPSLDPITVFLEDLGPRRGRATITCYNESWTATWGGMGDRTIAEFILSCDEHYLAGYFANNVSPNVIDIDNMANHARAHVCELRRKKDIDSDCARELFDKSENLEGIEHETTLYDIHYTLMRDIFGEEWWYGLPSVVNHKYEYVCRIINTVKDALRTNS